MSPMHGLKTFYWQPQFEASIKPLGGTQGDGAFTASACGDGRYAYSGPTGSADDPFEFMQRGLASCDAWLIQSRLRASSQIAPVCSPKGETIGWDIASTQDGLVLVEGNGSYGVSLLQIAAQRGLLANLERAIEA